MIDGIRFQFQQARIQAARRKLSRQCERRIKKEKKAGTSIDGIDQTHSEYSFEDDCLENDLMLRRSSHLIRIAQSMFIPTPPFQDSAWVRAADGSLRYHLTLEAQRDLAREVRKEKSERSERFRLWLAGLTGLVGAATGLAALLLRGGG
jgi:hypothetical protein